MIRTFVIRVPVDNDDAFLDFLNNNSIRTPTLANAAFWDNTFSFTYVIELDEEQALALKLGTEVRAFINIG